MHFIAELGIIFNDVNRVLGKQGLFAFTTKLPQEFDSSPAKYLKQMNEEFKIFSHKSDYIKSMCKEHGMNILKKQNCFIGEDIFSGWVARINR